MTHTKMITFYFSLYFTLDLLSKLSVKLKNLGGDRPTRPPASYAYANCCPPKISKTNGKITGKFLMNMCTHACMHACTHKENTPHHNYGSCVHVCMLLVHSVIGEASAATIRSSKSRFAMDILWYNDAILP